MGANNFSMSSTDISNLPAGQGTPFDRVLLQAPGFSQDSAASGSLHLRNEHTNLQYRINGVLLPDGVSGFTDFRDSGFIGNVTIVDGVLPSQYGLHTTGIIVVPARRQERRLWRSDGADGRPARRWLPKDRPRRDRVRPPAVMREAALLDILRRDRRCGACRRAAHLCDAARRRERGVVLLTFDEPSPGVDVSERADIHNLVRHAASTGACVIFASTELDEIVDLAGAVVTMFAGPITRIGSREDMTTSGILAEMTHGDAKKAGSQHRVSGVHHLRLAVLGLCVSWARARA